METETISKNGASPKSLMSRGNQNIKAEIMNLKITYLIIVFSTICSLGSLHGQERRVIGAVTTTFYWHWEDGTANWEQKVRMELMRVASNKYENAVDVQNISWLRVSEDLNCRSRNPNNSARSTCYTYQATGQVIGVGDTQETTKKCPYCSEKILSTAKKCKHCGEWLDRR